MLFVAARSRTDSTFVRNNAHFACLLICVWKSHYIRLSFSTISILQLQFSLYTIDLSTIQHNFLLATLIFYRFHYLVIFSLIILVYFYIIDQQSSLDFMQTKILCLLFSTVHGHFMDRYSLTTNTKAKRVIRSVTFRRVKNSLLVFDQLSYNFPSIPLYFISTITVSTLHYYFSTFKFNLQ